MKGKYIDSEGQIINIYIYSDGDICYYNLFYQSHRLDGPAIEYKNGGYTWWKEGKLHRIGGPALYNFNENYYEWWLNHKQVRMYYIYG